MLVSPQCNCIISMIISIESNNGAAIHATTAANGWMICWSFKSLFDFQYENMMKKNIIDTKKTAVDFAIRIFRKKGKRKIY